MFFPANEKATLNQNNQLDFEAYLSNQSKNRKMQNQEVITWQIKQLLSQILFFHITSSLFLSRGQGREG